ncbi:Plasma membrane ATPase [Sphaceloma murrayae]|uniref:Plasma membrane ATPase n=1 Tax=Sphaceloma murrayae TaxID=2082308 RepID=A0A2K1QNL4_9PEZI|nr:Plasma membrane ATPase [Sphaceloma murrayae]
MALLTDFDRALALGLGVGLGGLLALLVVGGILWFRLRRRKIRDSITELEGGITVTPSPSKNDNRLQRLSSFLRQDPNDSSRPSDGLVESLQAGTEDVTRMDFAKGRSAIPRTQFEIEIGNHGNSRSFRMKRLRSRDDVESLDQKPCRRKLSKRNLKTIDKPDSMPARLLVEETEAVDDLTRDSSPDSPLHHLAQTSRREYASVSPDRYTRVAATRTRSASAIIMRSTSSANIQSSTADRPLVHNRSVSYAAGMLGPAPIGPLPALPRSDQLRQASTSPTGSRDTTCKVEDLQSPRPTCRAAMVANSSLMQWISSTASKGHGSPGSPIDHLAGPLKPIGHPEPGPLHPFRFTDEEKVRIEKSEFS